MADFGPELRLSSPRTDGTNAQQEPAGRRPMNFTTGEILALVGVGVFLGGIVAAYMIISRKKGWM
ncbi:MAG: hypothetical protein CMJ54_10820 [Planctomycetaceae bacterium]|nr:hypothetical protein [Planctomycetaceae bacterium]